MRTLPWPLPALLSWAAAWAWRGFAPGTGPCGRCWCCQRRWALAWPCGPLWLPPPGAGVCGAGFPLSVLAMGRAVVCPPGGGWRPGFFALAGLPNASWRDAPVFPRPMPLNGLAAHLPLPDGARILDAGCGLGDGLVALRRAYPHAQLQGVEWSWMWWAVCALRCPGPGCGEVTCGRKTGR